MKTVNVTLTVELPEVEFTLDQLTEWLNFEFHATSKMEVSNPLSEYQAKTQRHSLFVGGVRTIK